MADPWPQWLTDSFLSANQPEFTNHEDAYNRPYSQLLYHLFGVEGPFEIIPQFHVPGTLHDTIHVIATFIVKLNKYPILFTKVKPPSPFHCISKCQQADNQMHTRFCDLHTSLITPCLHAISAFCTCIAFYKYTVATHAVTLPAITANPIFVNDVAPTN